jgi:alpha-tubulin suppressor-like RCC1 family protein
MLGLFCVGTSRASAQRWASVSVGSDHACAVDVDGRAYCWGYNHAAQLGARTEEHCGIVGESGHRSCYPVPSETEPRAVVGSIRFASVSAGRYATCGISRQQRLFCWGAAMGDSAGYADRCLEKRPCSFAPVPLDAGRAFARVNMDYRCGISADGEAVCWPDPTNSGERQVGGWPGLRLAYVDGEPGSENACAVLRDGRAVCRGEGAFGMLGNGARASSSSPLQVETTERFTIVAVAEHWVCALSRAGAAFCWGAAGYDDVQGAAPSSRPQLEVCERWAVRTWCNTRPAPVSGGMRFRSLTRVPRDHAMVGVAADGRAYTWGGDRVPRPWRPEQQWASVSAGDWGECGVTMAGELLCWGRNPHEAVRGRIPHPGVDAR